jgi:arsenate reductase (thioredoxin)
LKRKLKILFLCTGNSCRSQMAEGWTRYLKNDNIEPFSAGIEKHGLNSNAVKVMKESGVDISGQSSKLVSELDGVDFDCVIIVCGNANESCPHYPNKTKVIHIDFDDPPKLALAYNDDEKKLECYRKVRDEIKVFVEKLPEIIKYL